MKSIIRFLKRFYFFRLTKRIFLGFKIYLSSFIYKFYKIEKKSNNLFLKKEHATEFVIEKEENVIILTTPFVFYIAELVQFELNKHNIKSKITTNYDNKYKCPCIVICPQKFKTLPENRVVFFQMEQCNSFWFNNKYYNLLLKANYIFDYSLTNIDKLKQIGIPEFKLLYMPISPIPSKKINKIQERKIDVLFYGSDNYSRRLRYLHEIAKKIDIKIVNDTFGSNIKEILNDTKIVVNIHSFEQALLETCRINEALSCGCLVVSEESIDLDKHENFREVVDFVPADDIQAMIEQICFLLDDVENLVKRQKAILNYVNKYPNDFSLHFDRFLHDVYKGTC